MTMTAAQFQYHSAISLGIFVFWVSAISPGIFGFLVSLLEVVFLLETGEIS